MKVLMLNAGIGPKGNTGIALAEIGRTLAEQGIDSEVYHLPLTPARDCVSCGKCSKLGRCVFDDDGVNEFVEKAAASDGFVFGTPVYYAHPSGRILSALDRAFYAGSAAFRKKPGAAVAVARRAGTTASVEVLNKYFTIAEMPVVSSTYWNVAHGRAPGEVSQDAEGLQTMRNLAHNLAWLLRCIEAGKAAGITPPESERSNQTNFIR